MQGQPQNNDEYQNHIPEAVRRQAARSEQLVRELNGQAEPGADGGNPPSNGSDGEFLSSAPATYTPQTTNGRLTVSQEYTPPAQPNGAAPPAPQPAPSPDSPPADPGWEQRYRTLQGKYDSEMQGLRAQINGLQTVLASMQVAQAAAPPPTPPAPVPRTPPAPVVSAEDRETWGDDLPAAVARWADGGMADRFERLELENANLREELGRIGTHIGQTDQRLTQKEIGDALDRDPQLGGRLESGGVLWRVVNEDARFHAWLNDIDPFSGRLRMELLREAYAQGDLGRTAQFFRSFLTGHTAPAGSVVPTHTEGNGAGSGGASYTNGNGSAPPAGRVNLASLVAPGRASAPGGDNRGAQPEKRIWTNQEIGAFYRDVTRGVYRGREQDKLALEQDIFAAGREGRVQAG